MVEVDNIVVLVVVDFVGFRITIFNSNDKVIIKICQGKRNRANDNETTLKTTKSYLICNIYFI